MHISEIVSSGESFLPVKAKTSAPFCLASDAAARTFLLVPLVEKHHNTSLFVRYEKKISDIKSSFAKLTNVDNIWNLNCYAKWCFQIIRNFIKLLEHYCFDKIPVDDNDKMKTIREIIHSLNDLTEKSDEEIQKLHDDSIKTLTNGVKKEIEQKWKLQGDELIRQGILASWNTGINSKINKYFIEKTPVAGVSRT